MDPLMAKGAEKTVDYFSTYGPWAVLALILIGVICFAGWKIYTRMADALDRMHTQTVEMAQQHATAMKGVTDQYQKSMSEISEKHANVCGGFMDAIGDLGHRVTSLEGKVRN